MNWINELVNLYESNTDKIGQIEYNKNGPYVLLPLFHNTVTAQISVTIDQNGKFIDAELVNVEDKFTIIPVTEKSASRTSGKEPHPLCDNLKYIVGDCSLYCKKDREYYQLYISQLEKWYSSDFSHYKVKAIYKYLKKGTLMKDLIESKKIQLDEKGEIDIKQKIQGITLADAFVRFIVRNYERDTNQKVPDECWKDETLRTCYIEYVRSQKRKQGLCYMTGEMENISFLHPKKIRNEGDSAKLISCNDLQNFTFRGRFVEKEDAFLIGSESSQKVHNALKWIIRRQGTVFDTLTIVTWESNLLNMPRWDVDTETIEDEYKDDWVDDWEDTNVSDGNMMTAKIFYRALNGYGKHIENTSAMILLGLDAATPGRLSMVENMTLETSRYLKNIKKWHEDCSWIHEKWKEGKWMSFYGMVGVKDIADILYGMENKGNLKIVDKNSKKMYASVAKRLLPCIWSRNRIPKDYVNRSIEKASNPLMYKERKNWERVVTLACSLVKKYRKDLYCEEEWNVALNKKEKDRNYLYGRLLAVADRIEYRTYDEKDVKRVTNAKRYMNTFSKRPYETWKIIEENLQPYFNKLKIQERIFYENLLNEIFVLFDVDKFTNNKCLDGLYLLGFHSQSYDLKKKKENLEENEEE